MIVIDGAQGEGGGQILRTALALALVTGRAFRITRIRAGRDKPGLMRQHLTAVRAATAVGRAEVRGAELGSTELTFVPGTPAAGEYRFDVGTAGSATLVLQTVLPPLLRAGGPSRLTLTGGTHNQHAPPFDFLARTFAPLLNRLAATQPPDAPLLDLQLVRPGFYPVGGGELVATIHPPRGWQPLSLLERGAPRSRRARAVVSRLPRTIAERELRVVQQELGWPPESLVVEEVHTARGPGNVVVVELEYDAVTEVITAFGARGVRADAVAADAVAQTRRYLAGDAPVGEHLADQLLLPLVLGAGGTCAALDLTPHATTNIAVIGAFLEASIETRLMESGGCRLTVRGAALPKPDGRGSDRIIDRNFETLH